MDAFRNERNFTMDRLFLECTLQLLIFVSSTPIFWPRCISVFIVFLNRGVLAHRDIRRCTYDRISKDERVLVDILVIYVHEDTALYWYLWGLGCLFYATSVLSFSNLLFLFFSLLHSTLTPSSMSM